MDHIFFIPLFSSCAKDIGSRKKMAPKIFSGQDILAYLLFPSETGKTCFSFDMRYLQNYLDMKLWNLNKCRIKFTRNRVQPVASTDGIYYDWVRTYDLDSRKITIPDIWCVWSVKRIFHLIVYDWRDCGGDVRAWDRKSGAGSVTPTSTPIP